MSNLQNLLQWWNLLFALPLAVGMIFSLVTALGFVSGGHASAERGDVSHDMEVGHGEVEHDIGADADHGDLSDADLHAEHGDFEHGVDTQAELGDVAHPVETVHGEVSHDADAEHGHEAGHSDHNHHESALTQILEAFGIGRGVPLSVMLPFCMMLWGVLGLASNQALEPLLRFPAVYVWVSALLSLLGTSLLARGISGAVARYLQVGQAPSLSRERLIGATGVAVFAIDEKGGAANVFDSGGTVHRITCRVTEPGHPLPPGTPIVVTDYEVETGKYLVEENPFADSTTHQEVPK
jgi:membrane protein implicated in regulation of membrane protease activity